MENIFMINYENGYKCKYLSISTADGYCFFCPIVGNIETIYATSESVGVRFDEGIQVIFSERNIIINKRGKEIINERYKQLTRNEILEWIKEKVYYV